MKVSGNVLIALMGLSLAGGPLLGAPPAAPASPRDAMVVTTDWLAKHLSDRDLVLLHVGEKAEYEAGHIPGARFVVPSDLSVSDRAGGGLTLEMLPAEELRTRLAALGISDASRVVVYPGKDWISPVTRVIFTLDYAGLGAKAAYLDGGMDAWIAAGHPVTSDAPPPAAGKLAPLKPRPVVVDAERVRASLGKPGVAIVDARTAAYYDGTETGGPRGNPHCTGHVGGAVNVPFSSLFDDEAKLRPQGELDAIFAKAGVRRGDTVIAYCHIGQQATAVLFAARSLGHPVLLYDGSFEDWSRHAGFPAAGPGGRP